MRYAEQVKQYGLFYFVLGIFIRMIAWKSLYADGIKKFGVECRRVINFFCVTYQSGFCFAVNNS